MHRNGEAWPLITGLAVNVLTGSLFPATLTHRGPDLDIRLARTLTAAPHTVGLLDIYCPDREELRIGPFSYCPMRSVDMWLEATDEFILQSLNPCPEVVPDKQAFVRQVNHQGCSLGCRDF